MIDLEGQELRVVEVPQGDVSPSTVLHIPSIDTVIGGDVVYNRIHMMLALTGPAEWQKWIDSIDLVESLGAKTIIAGHKQPDASDQDLETILDGSRGYIRDFRDAVAASSTAKQVIEIMTARHPDYGNPTTLAFSAGERSPPHRNDDHDEHPAAPAHDRGRCRARPAAAAGSGRPLVDEFLDRGAAKVNATSRSPQPQRDPRIVPLNTEIAARFDASRAGPRDIGRLTAKVILAGDYEIVADGTTRGR